MCRYGECIHLKYLRSIHAIKLIWFEILNVIMQREVILLNFQFDNAKMFFRDIVKNGIH